ncbi:hypothetical protein J6590_012286 [Homalodisca vitripennis]|nr:hypothetical protein J6590_012286 [Homalodisca vitripennis]
MGASDNAPRVFVDVKKYTKIEKMEENTQEDSKRLHLAYHPATEHHPEETTLFPRGYFGLVTKNAEFIQRITPKQKYKRRLWPHKNERNEPVINAAVVRTSRRHLSCPRLGYYSKPIILSSISESDTASRLITGLEFNENLPPPHPRPPRAPRNTDTPHTPQGTVTDLHTRV